MPKFKKSSTTSDSRVLNIVEERKEALKDPRLPERSEDSMVNKPSSLPGVYKGKIKNVEQLKAYISKIPPAPSQTK